MNTFGIIWGLLFLVWDISWGLFAYRRGLYKESVIFAFCAGMQVVGTLIFIFL